MDTTDYAIIQEKKSLKAILKAFTETVSNGSALNPFNNPGFISLQHDIFLQSIEQEPRIIEFLKQKGFTFETVSQCLNDASPYKSEKDTPPPQNNTEISKVEKVTEQQTSNALKISVWPGMMLVFLAVNLV